MQLNNLKKIVSKRAKRLGRGLASGKGAKSGRGTTRHQTARETVPLHFEGGQGKFVKRFPLRRGKAKNKPVNKTIAIRLTQLAVFKDGETVSKESLIEKNIVSKKDKHKKIKIFCNGSINKKITVYLPVTPGVKEEIEKSGGSITV